MTNLPAVHFGPVRVLTRVRVPSTAFPGPPRLPLSSFPRTRASKKPCGTCALDAAPFNGKKEARMVVPRSTWIPPTSRCGWQCSGNRLIFRALMRHDHDHILPCGSRDDHLLLTDHDNTASGSATHDRQTGTGIVFPPCADTRYPWGEHDRSFPGTHEELSLIKFKALQSVMIHP